MSAKNQLVEDELGMHLVRRKIGRLPPIWTVGEGELLPYFCPALIRRGTKLELLGGVGVHIVDFELEWATKNKGSTSNTTKVGGLLLGLYLTNFASFQDPPAVDADTIGPWVRKIVALIDTFPKTFEALQSCARANAIGGFRFRSFYGRADKVKAAHEWFLAQGQPSPFEPI